MEQKEVFEKIVEIVTPFSKNKDALKAVRMETAILQDLAVNSARLVDIILAFEDQFDIEVDDDDADKVQTIGDAVKMIVSKTN